MRALTNVARAVQQDVEFSRKVRRIWAMIGGISYPNPPPERPLLPGESFLARPSHNVRCDVAAAKVVLESGIPLVMIGNDVTTRVRIDLEGIAQLDARQDALSQGVVRLMRVWLDYRSRLFGSPVTWTCLHDALVVAEACGMAFTTCDPVRVELQDDGATVVTGDPDSHIRVARTVREQDFERWYLTSVAAQAQL